MNCNDTIVDLSGKPAWLVDHLLGLLFLLLECQVLLLVFPVIFALDLFQEEPAASWSSLISGDVVQVLPYILDWSREHGQEVVSNMQSFILPCILTIEWLEEVRLGPSSFWEVDWYFTDCALHWWIRLNGSYCLLPTLECPLGKLICSEAVEVVVSLIAVEVVVDWLLLFLYGKSRWLRWLPVDWGWSPWYTECFPAEVAFLEQSFGLLGQINAREQIFLFLGDGKFAPSINKRCLGHLRPLSSHMGHVRFRIDIAFNLLWRQRTEQLEDGRVSQLTLILKLYCWWWCHLKVDFLRVSDVHALVVSWHGCLEAPVQWWSAAADGAWDLLDLEVAWGSSLLNLRFGVKLWLGHGQRYFVFEEELLCNVSLHFQPELGFLVCLGLFCKVWVFRLQFWCQSAFTLILFLFYLVCIKSTSFSGCASLFSPSGYWGTVCRFCCFIPHFRSCLCCLWTHLLCFPTSDCADFHLILPQTCLFSSSHGFVLRQRFPFLLLPRT